ncbi:vomeronasal type-2 receptor 26-like isoform X1 [Podarcis raffonei]|uniref:vomeronasal type-2 receptor 26-like isoform X1 n=1 Tax=Podarcis raffonei TaxID=65483 RepID=UPI0023297961|nr:vomeronasal type-2 receptor 26-like isoform X1 [Podarcis raffonei]XP_053216556.1 vomeronasal type-2 receptor 26-like isoform X1 [Podarcis raffonei]
MTYRTTLDLLFNSHSFVPNYKCGSQENVIGVIGGLSSEVTLCMADILGLYKIPQISYGSFEAATNDQIKFPSFYHMAPNEALQYQGIIQLLLHFGWKWVGLITPANEAGERFLNTIEPMFFKNGICSAFTERAEYHVHVTGKITDMLRETRILSPAFITSKANAVVVYGESASITWLSTALKLMKLSEFIFSQSKKNLREGKVWITTAQIDFILYELQKVIDVNIQMLHGAISFAIHSKEVHDFRDFLQHVNPSWEEGDDFISGFWEQTFDCSLAHTTKSTKIAKPCTGEEMLESLPAPFFEMSMTSHSYSIYNAVSALAHALHRHLAGSKHRRMEAAGRQSPQNIEPWKILHQGQSGKAGSSGPSRQRAHH